VEDLLLTFFNSWQVRTLLGLVLVDIVLGIARAIRMNDFTWYSVAEFYRSMIIPYLLGYLALYAAVNYIIPAEAGLEWLNQGLVTLAWGAIVGRLGASIKTNIEFIYDPEEEEIELTQG
jgi:hypothetical protein